MPHVSCFKLSENHISQSQRFNNSDSGCESRGHPAVRSSIFPVWFALSPPTAALARAPRLTWRRSCWACARNAGAGGPRGPSTCPSRNRSPECRCQTARVLDVSWRPCDAVYSPCGRRSGPPARRASRRVQRTRRTWNTAHNAPGVLTDKWHCVSQQKANIAFIQYGFFVEVTCDVSVSWQHAADEIHDRSGHRGDGRVGFAFFFLFCRLIRLFWIRSGGPASCRPPCGEIIHLIWTELNNNHETFTKHLRVRPEDV